MKNLLFLFIFVLLACQLWPQKQSDMLPQIEHKIYNEPIFHQHATHRQNPMFSEEMDFSILKKLRNEITLRVDSIYFENSGGCFKTIYSFDKNGNLISILSQKWDNSAWENDRLHTFTYNDNNNLLSDFSQYWENNKWLNSNLITYDYDSNENMLTLLSQIWENNEWLNILIYIYIYL